MAIVMMAPAVLPWPFSLVAFVACLVALIAVLRTKGTAGGLLVALVLAGVMGCAHRPHTGVVYVPYCEGIFYYLDPMCWKLP